MHQGRAGDGAEVRALISASSVRSAGARRRSRVPAWWAHGVRTILGLPGLVADSWTPRLQPPASDALSPEDALAWIHRSEQSAGMLALEEGMHRYRCEAGLVGYGVWGRTAFIAGGLHLAPGASAADLLDSFWAALRRQGFRRLLCLPVREKDRAAFDAAGGETLLIGAEAIVDLPEFSLAGGSRENLRQMCRRASRNGVRFVEVPAADAPGRLGSLQERWLAARPRGYRMALLVGEAGLGRVDGRRFFAAREQDGAFRSLVTVHPTASGRGAAVDALLRQDDAAPGAVDLLITETIALLQREGVEHLSLGGCPLVEPIPPGPDDPRALRFFIRKLGGSALGDALFSFQGLHHFKAKFQPRWEPIHLGGLPNAGIWSLYVGGRMWGLTGRPRLQRRSGV